MLAEQCTLASELVPDAMCIAWVALGPFWELLREAPLPCTGSLLSLRERLGDSDRGAVKPP